MFQNFAIVGHLCQVQDPDVVWIHVWCCSSRSKLNGIVTQKSDRATLRGRKSNRCATKTSKLFNELIST